MARHQARDASPPRWVKIFVWLGVVAALLVAAMIGVGHGPWQHM